MSGLLEDVKYALRQVRNNPRVLVLVDILTWPAQFKYILQYWTVFDRFQAS
jgi:hypothetical protein